MSLLQELQQHAFTARGMRDAMAGKLPTSEHGTYVKAYQIGALFRRANDYEIALVFGPGKRCPGCGGAWDLEGTHCQHPDGSLVRLEPGVFAAYGPTDEYDEEEFISARRIRQLAAAGIPVIDDEGDDITPGILLQ